MKNSIKRQLSLAISALLITAGLLNALIAFQDILQETGELQDTQLQTIADYIDPARPLLPALAHNPAEIYVQTSATPLEHRLIPLSSAPADGFYDWRQDGQNLRYYVKRYDQAYVLVIQDNAYRTALAYDTALDNSLPFLLLLPLLIAASLWIIRRKLKGVESLSHQLMQRQQADLSPLPTETIPTEIQGFVTALNGLLAKTQVAVEQQQRFIADAAHELRSPLTALSLQAERLADQDLPTPARQILQSIQDSIARNRHLVDQLLNLARAQAPHSPLPKSRLHSRRLFIQVIESLYPLAEQHAQDLGLADDKDYTFYAVETDMYTLIHTLTDNALRYTPPQSRVDLRVEESADELLFCVEDNGFGIAPAQRTRVLEPFYRLLGSKQQGTGLGLSIADSICRRYGGSLELADSPHFERGLLVRARLNKVFLRPEERS